MRDVSKKSVFTVSNKMRLKSACTVQNGAVMVLWINYSPSKPGITGLIPVFSSLEAIAPSPYDLSC